MITAETLGLSVMVGDAVFLKNLRNESIWSVVTKLNVVNCF